MEQGGRKHVSRAFPKSFGVGQRVLIKCRHQTSRGMVVQVGQDIKPSATEFRGGGGKISGRDGLYFLSYLPPFHLRDSFHPANGLRGMRVSSKDRRIKLTLGSVEIKEGGLSINWNRGFEFGIHRKIFLFLLLSFIDFLFFFVDI